MEGRGGRISIICIFAEGSQARGCVVIISRRGAEPSVVNNFEASREQGIGNATASFTGLPAGIYSVVILDIESDGSIDRSKKSLYEEVVIIDGPVMTSATSPTPTTRVATAATPSPSGLPLCLFFKDCDLVHVELLGWEGLGGCVWPLIVYSSVKWYSFSSDAVDVIPSEDVSSTLSTATIPGIIGKLRL